MTLDEMLEEMVQLCMENPRIVKLLEEICNHPDLPEIFRKADDLIAKRRLNS